MFRRSVIGVACAVCVASPGGARAATATYDITLGRSHESVTTPRSAYLSNHLGASFAPTEDLSLGLDGTWTRDFGAAATSPGGQRGGDVFLVAGNAALDLSERWWVGLDAFASPRSTTDTASAVSLAGTRTATPLDLDARVAAATSSAGAALSLGADVARTANGVTTVTVSLGGARYSTEQRITQITGRSGTVDAASLGARCAAQRCPRALVSILAGDADGLSQLDVNASVDHRIHDRLTLSLTGRVYAYGDDPTAAGFFSLTTLGRSSASFGTGLPVSPVRYSVTPGASYRSGRLTLKAAAGYARYVGDEGHNVNASTTLSFAWSEAWSITGGLAGQLDSDAFGTTSFSALITAGLRSRF